MLALLAPKEGSKKQMPYGALLLPYVLPRGAANYQSPLVTSAIRVIVCRR